MFCVDKVTNPPQHYILMLSDSGCLEVQINTILEEILDSLNNNELTDNADHELHTYCLVTLCLVV